MSVKWQGQRRGEHFRGRLGQGTPAGISFVGDVGDLQFIFAAGETKAHALPEPGIEQRATNRRYRAHPTAVEKGSKKGSVLTFCSGTDHQKHIGGNTIIICGEEEPVATTKAHAKAANLPHYK